MATMASAVRDIPTTFGHRDNLTAVAARSVPVTRLHSQPLPLPTPPNSISPSLPAHGLKAQLQSLKARLEPIDSDLDLHDGQGGRSALGSPPYDSAGAITPTMLARCHLPDILLNHGPLAIRHVMGYLTTSVPGFAGIPPAKARRLVVSALEGRGGEGGGLNGDVEFEKVGWGRWDARRRGQPSRERRASPTSSGVYEDGAIPIGKRSGGSGWKADRSRLAPYGSSNGDGDSAIAFSHDDRDITMLEHEADRMSMDGSASASCSEAPDDDVAMNDDPEDVTDDEDWAAVGAAALRATSYTASAQGRTDQAAFSSRVYTSGGGLRSFSATGGMARPPQLRMGGSFDFSGTALGGASDAQEREAIEALLRLGSM
ncbi:putative Sin3 binding protein-domain-containing protein [Coniochaeta sp. 2T2.1]|nr:putative Sin3 binding protein-domain-containing protein [Coniochaeta sp. 2T2.1]